MKAGDSVVYVDDPLLYGTGEIERVQPNGLVAVRFDEGGEEHFFMPHELELLDVWVQGANELAA